MDEKDVIRCKVIDRYTIKGTSSVFRISVRPREKSIEYIEYRFDNRLGQPGWEFYIGIRLVKKGGCRIEFGTSKGSHLRTSSDDSSRKRGGTITDNCITRRIFVH